MSLVIQVVGHPGHFAGGRALIGNSGEKSGGGDRLKFNHDQERREEAGEKVKGGGKGPRWADRICSSSLMGDNQGRREARGG